MDDKHHCKVGEPGNPVAAVERGKRVVVTEDKVFAVSDHDFAKFSVVPSVTMLVDIPESLEEGSFYRGQVYVGVKDLVLEPSSPLRHIAELMQILLDEELHSKPILCLYTDGGPDHRLTYLSVQLSLVCLFLSGDFDMLIAARTPPMGSWRNPPERIMSILNLALQAVGLMRSQASDECEKKLRSANGLGQLREVAKDPAMRQEMKDSIEPVKVLLTEMFRRLYLKDKKFKCFQAATEEAIEALWEQLQKFGPPLGHDMKQPSLKKELKDRPKLQDFFYHCTVSRSYFFTIRKCGNPECQICLPPRLPPDVFSQLHAFPDPVPGASTSPGIPNTGTRFVLSMSRQPQEYGRESCKLLLYNPSTTDTAYISVYHSLVEKINNDQWNVGSLMTSLTDIPDDYGLDKTSRTSNKGFEIISTVPIKVRLINIGSFSGDSTMVFPYTELGSRYYVITPCNASSTYNQAQIVSTNTSTTVVVTLSGDPSMDILTLGNKVYHGGEDITVTLDRYDVLHLTSYHSLTGTRISASNIVSVFTGCDFDFVDYTGQQNTADFYHKVEHTVDRTRLGRSFDFVAIEACRATIVASEAHTTFTVSDDSNCEEFSLLDEADKLEIPFTKGLAVMIDSNHPILVAIDSGRDLFHYLTPREQEISKTTYCVDHLSIAQFSMSVNKGCGMDFSANGNNLELNRDIFNVKCYDSDTKCLYTSRDYTSTVGCHTVKNSCGSFHGVVLIDATQWKVEMEETLGNAMTVVSPSCSAGQSGANTCSNVVVSCVSTTTSITTVSNGACENGGSLYSPAGGNTRCYWVSGISTSAMDAKQKCTDSNGELALIPDPSVNSFIAELIMNKGYTVFWFYIGYRYLKNELRSMTNNDLQSWAEWEQGEPTNVQYEDYVAVQLVGNILKWHNVMVTASNFRSLCMSSYESTIELTDTTTTTEAPDTTSIEAPDTTTSTEALETTSTEAPDTTTSTEELDSTTSTEAPDTTTTTEAPDTTTSTTAPGTIPTATALASSTEAATFTGTPCNCTCAQTPTKNLTDEVLEEIQKMKKELEVDKTVLSSTIRSKTSAEDPRPSATFVGGTFSVVFMTFIFGGFVLMDFPVLVALVKQMMAFIRRIT